MHKHKQVKKNKKHKPDSSVNRIIKSLHVTYIASVMHAEINNSQSNVFHYTYEQYLFGTLIEKSLLQGDLALYLVDVFLCAALPIINQVRRDAHNNN